MSVAWIHNHDFNLTPIVKPAEMIDYHQNIIENDNNNGNKNTHKNLQLLS